MYDVISCNSCIQNALQLFSRFPAMYSYRAHGTSTEVEFTIMFMNGTDVWKVNSLFENITATSFNVLIDGFEYAILKEY